MTDFFVLLDEPRRPWLEPTSLKAKFLARSAQVHPDHIHNASDLAKAAAVRRYAELNAAFNCLRDPRERLAHLLQLELGAKPPDLQQMPDDLVETFMLVAQFCRHADAFLMEKARATSAILQVQFFEPAQKWVEKLTVLQRTLADRQVMLTEKLKALDAQWVATRANAVARREVLQELEKLYHHVGFFTRWLGQIQERLVRLAG